MNLSKESKKRQDPAYRLYTSDFIVRNMDLSDEQMGKLIRLICYQHQNGHLPETTMDCISKKDPLVTVRFKKDSDGLYFNEEVEDEVIRRLQVKEKATDNVNKRWHPENNDKSNTTENDDYLL